MCLVVCLVVCLVCGCQSIRNTARPARFAHEHQCEQIILHSDLQLSEQQQLVDELCAQRQLLAGKLGLPTTDMPIHIYLFADAASYYEFLDLRFHGFPHRRAIFVETKFEMTIYAHWGEHVAEDLRHEVTHGYLHAALPRLPLWLDEGLAEYFEVGGARQGLNASHLDQLRGLNNFRPNLARLEQLSSPEDMTQLDYAESWAWVHLLMQSGVDATNLLTDYLADLQQGSATMLSTQLQKRWANPELALAKHLQTLR